MKNIIFIIGVGRSGTTLIQSMLHSHSEIKFSPETHFVKRYIRFEVDKKHYGWDKVELLKKQLLNDVNLKEYKKNISEVINKSVLEKPNKYLTASVFYNLLDSENVRFIGDKDPMNVNYLSIIKKSFPDAFIIHIIRDPRDVVSSRISSNWGSGKSVLWHASEYKFSVTKARREGFSLFKNKYMELKFESLLTSTEDELKKVCEFLNLSFEENMLNHQIKARSLLRNDELDWKSNVLKPVDSSKIGNWKKNLSSKQLVIIEVLLSSLFGKLGYKPSLDISFYKKCVYSIKGLFVGLLFKIRFG